MWEACRALFCIRTVTGVCGKSICHDKRLLTVVTLRPSSFWFRAVVKSLFFVFAFVLLLSVVAFSNEGVERATLDPAGDLEEVQNLNLELLRSVTCVVMSEDGKFLYAAAYNGDVVAAFSRDAATGQLELEQDISSKELDALQGVFRVACSPDGRNVYASAGRFGGDQAISVFKTQGDGKVELLEEHVNGVAGFSGFEGGNDIKVSPDGRLVYALGTLSDRLVRFAREPATGKLTFLNLGSQSVGLKVLPGSANLAFSPDGKFVYVADEDANSIVVFKQPIKDAAP